MTTTLIVGAGKGIGRATAIALDRAGRRVALADIDTDALAETAAMLSDSVSVHVVDVRDRGAVSTMVSEIESGIGPISALAHVAGVLDTGTILDSDIDDWRKLFDINVFGLLNVVQAVGGPMRERGAGAVVVVGSNAAGIPRMSMGAYGSSKAAATMLTRVLGLELAQYGIRANIVAPGSTDTEMQRSLWADPTDERGAQPMVDGDLATYKTGIPLGRIASAEDIADSIEFLLSDRARHITMQALYVDGGATLRA